MQSNAIRQVILPDRLQEGPKQMCPFTVQFTLFWQCFGLVAGPYK